MLVSTVVSRIYRMGACGLSYEISFVLRACDTSTKFAQTKQRKEKQAKLTKFFFRFGFKAVSEYLCYSLYNIVAFLLASH